MTSIFTMLIAIIVTVSLAAIINSFVCSGESSDEAAEIIALATTDNFLEI